MTRHALGAQRLPPDVALRTIDPGLQAHRDVLDPCSIELGREGKDYDRLGNTEKTMDILGVELPLVELPVRPGRSLATIVEIAARNWRLKAEGYDAVAELDRRLQKHYNRMAD